MTIQTYCPFMQFRPSRRWSSRSLRPAVFGCAVVGLSLACAAPLRGAAAASAQPAAASAATSDSTPGQSLELARDASLSGAEAPRIANIPLQIRAVVANASKGGVIASQGAQINGWALYVKDNKPVFAVRRKNTLFELEAAKPLPNEEVELIGELKQDGTARLLVNGLEVARGNAGGLIPAQPNDPLLVGNDLQGAVGNYKTPMPFGGVVRRANFVTGAIELPQRHTHSPLSTRWAKDVDPKNVLPEYPRPQLVRKTADGKPDWTNLNGQWTYAIRPADEDTAKAVAALQAGGDGSILVPFAVEAKLSGVQRMVGRDYALWYRRTFTKPATPSDHRTMLNFGAVDWDARVFVNGKPVGEHKGCYTGFSIDITDALKGDGEQELIVRVWDPTDTGTQARGKQVENPFGIWYTPVTGIWQTVWLESVPATHVVAIKPVTDLARKTLSLQTSVAAARPGDTIRAVMSDGGKEVARAEGKAGEPLVLTVESPKTWSPDSPHLYDLSLEVLRDGKSVDHVDSYAAMRTIAVGPDESGFTRLLLNGKPLFQYGPLDQGWWPDGLYTAPTDAALRGDVDTMKRMGFNMIRKHVKLEPARWYYHCDQLGMLVWQDIVGGFARPEGGPGHVPADASADWKRPPDSVEIFEREMHEMVHALESFPSIVCWTAFNEGWGQFETPRVVKELQDLDPSRIVNGVSGWRQQPVGNMNDAHHYPGPGMEPTEQNAGRSVVLGEFGGLGLAMPGHLWEEGRNWGYQSFASPDALKKRYAALIGDLSGMIDRGLSAAVYTQLTDVEIEINGLLTYDREVAKMDIGWLHDLHQTLYKPAKKAIDYVRDSEVSPQEWKLSHDKPADDAWTQAGFDDGKWQPAKGPIATPGQAFISSGTPWGKGPLWLRRTFEVKEPSLPGLSLRVFSSDEIDVYVNGQKVYSRSRDERLGNRHYTDLDISQFAKLIKAGKNVLAVAARPVGPKHAVDVGLYGHSRPSQASLNGNVDRSSGQTPSNRNVQPVQPAQPAGGQTNGQTNGQSNDQANGVVSVTAAAAVQPLGKSVTIGDPKQFPPQRPNVLIILADDLGFSDPGCFGGDIQTPNIDKLAAGGLRFTQFYNASRCCPTRASLISGQYAHKVGLARNGQSLTRNALTIAEGMKLAGYNTAMSGKWHLSLCTELPDPKQHQKWLDHQIDPGIPFAPLDTYPVSRGFDRHYGMIWGVFDYFDPFSLVDGKEAVKTVPKDYYATNAITDHTVQYIQDFSKDKDKPFFIYLAYTASHWPLHALPEDLAKYKGKYDAGWDAMRKARFDRQVKMGLFDPAVTPLPPVMGQGKHNEAWDQLSPEQKKFESGKYETHAAMVDRMDQGIGRVMDALKQTGRLDNTMVIFLADNGASPEIPAQPGYDRSSQTRDGRKILYTGFDHPGPETTYTGIGPQWANAANTPFRYWKVESFEGGNHTPAIVYWPQGLKTKPGSMTNDVSHVIDLLPTCLDVAGQQYPAEYQGHPLTPLDGQTLVPVLNGQQRPGHDVLYFEHEGGRAIRVGDWKLVKPKGPASAPWELYDLAHDATETHNLATEQPQKTKEMDDRWTAWAKQVGVPGLNPSPDGGKAKGKKKAKAAAE